MRRALFLKEFRYLRPFLFLALAILLIDIVDKLLDPSALQAFSQSLVSLPGQLAASQILLGFALGSGLLVREIDDGTLNFLDGLPLTRGAVFAAKFEAAILVLAVYPFGLIVLYTLMHLAARESLDHALHPLLLLTFFGLSMLVSAVSLTFGMLLGFLRYLSWLVLSLCAIGIALLKDGAPAWGAALNSAELLALRFTGAKWHLPYATIWTQLGAALLFALLAFGLFKASGGMLARVRKWQRARRLLLVPAVALMLVAAVSGLVVLQQRGPGPETLDKMVKDVHFTPSAGGHATTAHYSFSYPALGGERIKPFIAQADRTFTDVAALLQIDGGTPIDVDLSGSTENHLGTAYFDRIRMKVQGAKSTGVLAHETTHVFARRLSGGERGAQLDGMTVFNEGLAQWVEGRLSAQGQASAQQELAAAIVSARRLLTPRQLTDYAAFAGIVDEDLKYPLGAAFIERFVRRYGAAAPKTLLHTLASPDFPRDLKGYALWQTAFQLSGYDLDLVFDDYARYLKGLEPKFARQIAALPRPRGSLLVTGALYEVALRLDQPLPEDAGLLVRFRPGADSGSEQYRVSYSYLSDAGKPLAVVPENVIARGEICFQPGLRYGGIVVYEPWACLPAASAKVTTASDR